MQSEILTDSTKALVWILNKLEFLCSTCDPVHLYTHDISLGVEWSGDAVRKMTSRSVPGGSSFPVANNVLQRRWNARNYQMHVAKKGGMKTKLDATSPKVYPHLQVNMKKLQAEEEKQAVIDHENRILLAKLTNIIRSGGQLDNWNFEFESRPKTLNAPYKSREQQRIDRENAALLKRLNSVKPQVNFDKMEDDYLMHSYFLAQKAQATKSFEVDNRGVENGDRFVFYAKDRHDKKEKTFVDSGDIEETIEEPVEGTVTELTSTKTGGVAGAKRLPTRQQLKRRSTKLPLIGAERKKAEDKKKKDIMVRPATYNQKDEAAKLFKATKGMGNPEQILVQTLAKRTYQQRQDTMAKFEENYGLTLEEELKNNLNAEYDDIVDALLATREDLDATTLRRALKGDDSLVEPFIEIMCTRSNAAIGAIKEVYNAKFGVSLEDDVAAEIKGKLKNLFLALAKGSRSEEAEVDEQAALTDAEALRDAGSEERWSPRSTKMAELLQHSSLLHLREVFLQYDKLTESNLEKELEKSLLGDFKDAMLCFVRCLNSGTQYLADRLHVSLIGEADDMMLIRIIVTRSELDLPLIRRCYKRKYKQTLVESLEQRCQASYKAALVQMVVVHGAPRAEQPKDLEPPPDVRQSTSAPTTTSTTTTAKRPLKRPSPKPGAKVPSTNPLLRSTVQQGGSDVTRRVTPGTPNKPSQGGLRPKQLTPALASPGKPKQTPSVKSGATKKASSPLRRSTPPKPVKAADKGATKSQPLTEKNVAAESVVVQKDKNESEKIEEEVNTKKEEGKENNDGDGAAKTDRMVKAQKMEEPKEEAEGSTDVDMTSVSATESDRSSEVVSMSTESDVKSGETGGGGEGEIRDSTEDGEDKVKDEQEETNNQEDS